jgi:hypothetical protein
MNERIKELIEQSGFGSYAEIPDTYIVHKNDLAEFAELIVQDCCRMMQGFTFEEIVVGVLKTRFGVKE